MVLPVLGVAIGVGAFTIVLSIMGGFVGNLKERLLGIEPHLEVIRKDVFGYIEPSDDLLARLSSEDQVEAVSPFQIGEAILQGRKRPITVTLMGIEPERADVFLRFEKFLEAGEPFSTLALERPVRSNDLEEQGSFPAVVIGSGVAHTLDARVGDRVTFVSTIPEEGAFGLAPKQLPAVVADVLDTGSARYDGKIVLTTIEFANRFFGVEKGWAGIQVLVDEPFDADQIAAKMDRELEAYSARAKPWTEKNAALLRALKLERWGMSFVLYMVILVGCFTIAITLVLSVRRKAREMAILRAIGFERRELGQVYLLQGLVIGGVGVSLGMAIGLTALQILSHVDLPFITGAYSGRPFPVLVDWGDCLRVIVGSLILSAVASFWPAWEVMRINVVETLSDRT